MRHHAAILGILGLGGALTFSLVGCGISNVSAFPPPPVARPGASVSGIVMGGQQPVAGVSLQLYQAGTSSYGGGARALGPPATTTAAGNFILPAYSCDSGSQVYLVGTGGTPIGGASNSNLALISGLGTCGGPNLSRFINLNEVTTVATVWALAPFMSSATSIGAPPSNAVGLANAFSVISQLVDTATGITSGPALPAGAILPIAEINSLADILQNCVNSAGGSAGDSTDGFTDGTPCGKLFFLTKTPTSTPSDTLAAALAIAKNPGQNVAKLNALQATSPAFQPRLSVNSPPLAWTIAVAYAGGGINSPAALAADASGSIWVANRGNNSVSKFDFAGVALSGAEGFQAGGFSTPVAIAVDPLGSVWVANQGNNTITTLNQTGSSGTVYSGNGILNPNAIAVDGSGNVFVTGSNGVSAFSNAGLPLNGSPFATTGDTRLVTIAVNPK